MQADKPYSPSCEQNREPILEILKRHLPNTGTLLEIGSGTGQHAVYFAPEFPGLTWQTSDVAANHPGIRAWLAAMPSDNIYPPFALDVLSDPCPNEKYNVVFSANTAHIMHEPAVEKMFACIGRILNSNGLFILYGPFNIDGQYTAPSNREFDQMLKMGDPNKGVRDITWLQSLAEQNSLGHDAMVDMPADNKILLWRKFSTSR